MALVVRWQVGGPTLCPLIEGKPEIDSPLSEHPRVPWVVRDQFGSVSLVDVRADRPRTSGRVADLRHLVQDVGQGQGDGQELFCVRLQLVDGSVLLCLDIRNRLGRTRSIESGHAGDDLY